MGDGVYFHVGILVGDLDAAIGKFSRVLGLTFNTPMTANFARLEDPDPRQGFVRCTYSREGPPYIELLEANGDGLFSLSHGEGVHHLGLWEPDTDGRCAALRSLGVGQEARVVSPEGGTFALFTRPEDLFGTRFELLHESSRAVTEEWIATGQFGGATDL
jgi:catechol 2,3-dioxygenase-like lactoylglutathione lyase family enzyme